MGKRIRNGLDRWKKDLSEQMELEDSEKFTENAKTVNDRQASATAAWMEMVKNTPELEEWMKNNPDATVEEMRDNFGDDVADAYMELSKAKSMKDGFVQNTAQKIEDAVQNQVAQARFTGTMQNKQGIKVVADNTVTIFTDKDGNEYTLVGGDVIVDAAGDGSYSVGKSGLVIFRDKDGNIVQRTNFDGLTEVGTMSAEEYANRIRTTLQEQKTAEIQSTETPLPEVQKEEPKGEGGETPTAKEEGPRDEEEKSDEGNLKPVGTGAFGPVYDQFRGKPKEAVAFLSEKQDGEALGALHHDAVGDIDLVWGKAGTKHSDGFGLSKLIKYHPEVVEHLQEILNDMKVDKVSPNRINLSSDKYKAAIRLDYDGESKTWLLTAYEKEKSPDSNKTTDTATISLKGDTALSQSEDSSSDGKGTTKSADSQENNETLTFKDGTVVPMTKDSKGRPTADYGKMTPEQAAEYITTAFGDNKEKVVDGKIKKAEAAVKAANKIKVDYSADDADILEAEEKKKTAVEAAEKDLAFYTSVKNEMKKKTAVESAGGTGATGNRYEQWRKMGIPAFANAKNLKEARAAVQAEIEKGNNSLFGEAPLREEFSTFELEHCDNVQRTERPEDTCRLV